MELDALPRAISIQCSGCANTDGVYKRMKDDNRDKPCYMKGNKKEPMYLYWLRGKWKIGYKLDNRKSFAFSKDETDQTHLCDTSRTWEVYDRVAKEFNPVSVGMRVNSVDASEQVRKRKPSSDVKEACTPGTDNDISSSMVGSVTKRKKQEPTDRDAKEFKPVSVDARKRKSSRDVKVPCTPGTGNDISSSKAGSVTKCKKQEPTGSSNKKRKKQALVSSSSSASSGSSSTSSDDGKAQKSSPPLSQEVPARGSGDVAKELPEAAAKQLDMRLRLALSAMGDIDKQQMALESFEEKLLTSKYCQNMKPEVIRLVIAGVQQEFGTKRHGTQESTVGGLSPVKGMPAPSQRNLNLSEQPMTPPKL